MHGFERQKLHWSIERWLKSSYVPVKYFQYLYLTYPVSSNIKKWPRRSLNFKSAMNPLSLEFR